MERKKQKSLTGALASEWERCNILENAKGGAIIALIAMAVFMVIDSIQLSKSEMYLQNMQLRISLIIIASCILWTLHELSKKEVVGEIPSRPRGFVYSLFFVALILLCNAMYLVFICSAPKELKMTATIGAVCAIFCINSLSYRFSVQHTCSVIGSLFLTYMAMAFTDDDLYLEPVLTSQIGIMLVMIFLRKRFRKSLGINYSNLLAIAPPQVARQIVISNSDIRKSSAFVPKDLFVAVIISDWRNYQEICKRLSPIQIADLLAKYYDRVFAMLDEVIKGGNYYANWNADELFIVIYETSTISPQQVTDLSSTVAMHLATDIFTAMDSGSQKILMYDIGVATGIGLVGLQGPQESKKTTVIGSVPGFAKRCETEAKLIRAEAATQGKPIAAPIVVLGSESESFHSTSTKFESARARTAVTKDIAGQQVNFWYETMDSGNVIDIKAYQADRQPEVDIKKIK